jgi:hypothetical protein
MRPIVIALLILFVGSAEARAASGGKGGPAPGSTGGGVGPGGGGPSSAGQADIRGQLREGEGAEKWWSVGAGWETHALFWQNNLDGAGASKLFNYGSLFAGATFLDYNHVSVNFAFYWRFLADEGESGMRLDDVTLVYVRTIPLGYDLTLQPRLTVALPTSFEASKIGLIVAPTVGVQLNWQPRPDVFAAIRPFATHYFDRYSVAEGGSANSSNRLGVLMFGEYTLPVLEEMSRPISVGADVYAAWYWNFEVQGSASPNMSLPRPTADATFPTQPPHQRYGGELYARYTFPTFYDVRSDIRVALADGDSSLGYNSLLHDGVSHLYLSYFKTAEIYGALTARY